MKKYLLGVWLTISTSLLYAQHDHNSHQKQPGSKGSDSVARSSSALNEATQKQLAKLLSSYYNIKNALVAGDATSAGSNAGEFLRTVNTIDYKVLSEGNIHTLAKNAGDITETRDLAKQRELFATLSSNMIAVARAFKLTAQPVYLQYCPMKKASWLSAEKEIRNPYYGSAMLTCGEVTESL